MTMQLIETVTLTSAASSIEFTSIPQDGVDLLLKFSLRKDNTFEFAYAQFNNDTASNYTYLYLYGNGASALSSVTGASQPQCLIGFVSDSSDTANTFGNGQVLIPNYTSSASKSISSDSVSENNATTAYQTILAGNYAGTSPITSLKIIGVSGDFVSGSTASLYKIS